MYTNRRVCTAVYDSGFLDHLERCIYYVYTWAPFVGRPVVAAIRGGVGSASSSAVGAHVARRAAEEAADDDN